MLRFGHFSLEARGFLIESHESALLREQDELVLLSALVFLLEAAEESDDPRITIRAAEHLRGAALARLHRCGMNCVRELPRRVPVRITRVDHSRFPENLSVEPYEMKEPDAKAIHAGFFNWLRAQLELARAGA